MLPAFSFMVLSGVPHLLSSTRLCKALLATAANKTLHRPCAYITCVYDFGLLAPGSLPSILFILSGSHHCCHLVHLWWPSALEHIAHLSLNLLHPQQLAWWFPRVSDIWNWVKSRLSFPAGLGANTTASVPPRQAKGSLGCPGDCNYLLPTT